jgi:hypothetical protein
MPRWNWLVSRFAGLSRFKCIWGRARRESSRSPKEEVRETHPCCSTVKIIDSAVRRAKVKPEVGGSLVIGTVSAQPSALVLEGVFDNPASEPI